MTVKSWVLTHLFPSSKQTLWCYCPSCGNDLCSQPNAFISDVGEAEHNVVTYWCKCGHASQWNFDLFPCPVTLPLADDTPLQEVQTA